MALIVEDGTGLPNSESYISVANAEIYMVANKLSTVLTAWTAASEANKEVAARQATDYLDGKYRWRGSTEKPQAGSGDTQALDWPRIGVTDEQGVEYDGLPQQLIDATAEMMFLVIDGTTISVNVDRGKRVKRQKADVLEREFEPGAAQQPSFPVVNRLISELVWPSGTVVRS